MAFLILAFSVATTAAAKEPKFTEIVVDAGFFVEQPVLFANLGNDGRQHIVLAGHNDDHQQRLAVFPVDPDREARHEPILSVSPGANLIAYDVGQVGASEGLFFIEPGRIVRYDFGAGQLVEVSQVQTIYGQERANAIIPLDFVRDVNDDGLDDLVVPGVAGYRVRLQRADGSLGDEILLQESSRMTVSNGNARFDSRPLVTGEMTFDGLTDLAVWRGNLLHIYPQLPGDRFQSKPLVVPLGLGLFTEAQNQARQSEFLGSVDQSGLRETRIWSIEDLNNDGIPDILTEATLSQGVFDKQNDMRLHLGRRDGDELVYNDAEDALLASEGLQYDLITTDIDGDGKQDLLVRKVRLSFARVIKALLSGNVSLRMNFFRMTADDDYPKDPNYVTKTNVQFSMKSGHVDIPAIQIADFDADGLQDLTIQTDSDELSFYHGIPTRKLFDEDAIELDVRLPRNGDLVTSEDIDEDGRADLIIRYDAADGRKTAQTVRLLVTEHAQ